MNGLESLVIEVLTTINGGGSLLASVFVSSLVLMISMII